MSSPKPASVCPRRSTRTAKTDDVTQVPLHHAPAANKVIHTMLSTAHEHMETEGAG